MGLLIDTDGAVVLVFNGEIYVAKQDSAPLRTGRRDDLSIDVRVVGAAADRGEAGGLPVVAAELDYVRDVADPEESFDPTSPTSIARAVKRFMGKDKEAAGPSWERPHRRSPEEDPDGVPGGGDWLGWERECES